MIDDKAALRQRCHAIRAAFAPEKVRLDSRAVCDHLSAWGPLQQAQTVLSFLAFRNEIDLAPLFERWTDKLWLVPRVVERAELAPDEKPRLQVHPYHPERLVRHRFGMLEPDPSLPRADPAEIDLVLVPGLAFDRQGGRLGYGGGFYDRLLPLTDGATTIGVTYDELVVDSIPMARWDFRVEWFVTPSGIEETAHRA